MILTFRCLISFALAGVMVAPVLAAGIDRCPKLSVKSDLSWQVSEGPDFSICYASTKSASSGIIGVYLGFHPNFQPADAQSIRSGTIESEQVTWYQKQPTDIRFKVGAEVLHTIGPHVAHIWVMASGSQELASLMSEAEQLQFRKAP